MQSDYREKTPAEKRKFWEEQIRLWQESGLSQSEYCRRYSIGTSRWFYWRKRCRDTETGLTLVPLKLSKIIGIGGKTPAVRVITPNGFTIELDHDASRLSLPQLIREVAAI
jgi:hypothetical protein